MRSEGVHTKHLSPDTIRAYLNGKLDPAQMHDIEMHLLECDFCSDALEGFELSEKADIRTDRSLLALRRQLNRRIREHGQPKLIRWPAWSAAAAIALAIAGYVVIMYSEREQREQAARETAAFLETGEQDTLLIFMPGAPEPYVPEELIASNTLPAAGNVPSASVSSANALSAGGGRSRGGISEERGISEENGVSSRNSGLQEEQETDSAPAAGSDALSRNDLPAERTISPAPPAAAKERRAFAAAPETGDTGMADSTRSLPASRRAAGQRAADSATADRAAAPGSRVAAVAGEVKSAAPPAARPRGGRAAYEKYLADSLRYPPNALRQRIEGPVRVRFTVLPDGTPGHFEVEHSLGYGCDEEAVRLIREGPLWEPASGKEAKGTSGQAPSVVQTVIFELPPGRKNEN